MTNTVGITWKKYISGKRFPSVGTPGPGDVRTVSRVLAASFVRDGYADYILCAKTEKTEPKKTKPKEI